MGVPFCILFCILFLVHNRHGGQDGCVYSSKIDEIPKACGEGG